MSEQTLGQRIHAARTAAGMSLRELARVFDVRLEVVQSWERDLVKPSPARMAILVERFGVAPEPKPTKATTRRVCLTCRKDFESLWIGNRVCGGCKDTISWAVA